MSVAADLVAILQASVPVTSLCTINKKTGTHAIRPDKLSQNDVFTGALGAIQVTTVSHEWLNDLSGSDQAGIVKVLIDCVSMTSTLSNALADQVIMLIEPFRGATVGGFIDAVDLIDRREDWASTDDGRETGEYVAELEVNVFYLHRR